MFIERALESQHKDPNSEFCRWNKYVGMARFHSVFENRDYEPTANRPLVYHLLGRIDIPESIVLTETDFFDFSSKLTEVEDDHILPRIIRDALTYNPLLLVGVNLLSDSRFRFIFQTLATLSRNLRPSLRGMICMLYPDIYMEGKREHLVRYIEQYVSNMFNLQVNWTDLHNFARELRNRINSLNSDKIVDIKNKYNSTTSPSLGKIQTDASWLTNYYEKSHTVIIGISKYKEESPLPNAYNDAIAIQKILEDKYGFTTLVNLFDDYATADNIREIFTDKLRDETKIGRKDRVLVYYSGHGKLRTQIGFNGEEIKQGYIIPYDSKSKVFESYIPMETLTQGCHLCIAKHVLLILDCCYSGYAIIRGEDPEKPKKLTDRYLNDITSRRAIQVLAAGQEDKPVSDSGILPGYSAFTGALLTILKSGKDFDNDGVLTASEIGYALEREIALQTLGMFQRPVSAHIAGRDDGDFLLKIFKRF